MNSFVVLVLATLAAGSPISVNGNQPTARIYERQTGIVAKEFSTGGCKDNIFIFSRGSTEVGNMVIHLLSLPVAIYSVKISSLSLLTSA
jgi:cutinase